MQPVSADALRLLVQERMLAATQPVIDIGTPDPSAVRVRRDTPMTDSRGNQRSVEELRVRPGTAEYRSLIPPPPCAACGQDHAPNLAYPHAYVHPDTQEKPVMSSVTDVIPPTSNLPTSNLSPQPATNTGPTTKRVAIYPGRGEDFIVTVEESPDWDSETSHKLNPATVVRLVPLLRELGIKIKDATGGDLVAAMQDHAG